MRPFFAPNLDRRGRRVRGLMGLLCLVGAALSLGTSLWLAGLLAAAGLFALLEAVRGWCFARACGLKTRL